MKYPFEIGEKTIYDFEQVLKPLGISIKPKTDLERVCLCVLEANAIHKREQAHDDKLDIRPFIADVAGVIDFTTKIVKHKNHADFRSLIPHLELLNEASNPLMTSRSKITDDGNNKLMELYLSLLCMDFGTNITLDDPNNSKGDNPDIMFSYGGTKWAIACKAMHSNNHKTLYDAIEKGTEQIIRSSADKGIVVVNFKNIIDWDEIWPITNKQNVDQGSDPLFGCFPSADIPFKLLTNYGNQSHSDLINIIGLENLLKLRTEKSPAAFLIFLQAITSINDGNYCPPTILKTFNLIEFEKTDSEYLDLLNRMNEAMHDRYNPPLT